VHGGIPQALTGQHSLCGVYYGQVTQNKDEDKLARIKVKFPWMPNADQDQSHWAKIVVPMEGHEYGTYTVPEIDDIVMVMFMAGDIRFPVIVGGAWSKTDTPPETNEDGKNDFRFIKSRSGRRLLYDDASGSIKVVLTDKNNQCYVGCGTFKEASSQSPNKIELKTPGGQKGVAVTSLKGAVNIHCPKGKLSVQGMNLEMNTDQAFELKAGGELTIEGGTQLSVSSTSDGKFEGSQTNFGP
jgi:uncharacterized protein involved in type VI secretion and phage assembly